jgi:hypothetical protein
MPSIDGAPGLAALQQRFVEALRADRDCVPQGVTSHSDPHPIKRFHIYRNNVHSSLIGVLRARFPVVERLVGEEFFRAAARIFVEAHPPRSPALFEYGGEFIPFLETFEPARELPYLPDVARLEWLRNRAYHAADAEPVPPADLAAVAPDDLPRLRLGLHPSAQLFASDYPAVSIWEANAQGGEVAPLAEGLAQEDALILRPRLEVLVLRLGPGGHAFADALARQEPLAGAAGAAVEADSRFSLPETLGALIGAGAFSGFSIASQVEGQTP